MKITETKIRSIIRKSLIFERAIANVSEITQQSAFLDEWADLLLDELQYKLTNGKKMNEWTESQRARHVKNIRKSVVQYLISALGYSGGRDY